MTSPNDFFGGKTAFITGSGRGIGRALALELARHGCHILLHYNKNIASAQNTQAELEALGVKTWLYQADLCDPAQTEALLQKIAAEHQTLDIFIANAASTAFKALSDQSVANVTKTFHLVVTSFLLCVQRLTPLLRGRESRILTISGIDTTHFCPGHGLLAAAKAALETLSKYLSVELAAEKIHVKCLNPGLVASDSTRFYLGELFEKICRQADQVAPHGGFVHPDVLARLALALLRPDTDWLAGQTVHANGGLSFMLPGLTELG